MKSIKTHSESRVTLLVFALIIIVFIIYNNTLSGFFLNWDDISYISQNPLITNPISFESFKELYAYEKNISFVLFTFLIQHYFFGFEPFSYHLINVLIHVLNVAVVFYLSRKLCGKTLPSFVIAILFALHPMRSETVGWIIQRKDLLFTFFFLTGILSYIKFRESRKIIFLFVIVICSFISHLCKVQAFALPFAMVLTDIYIKGKFDKDTFLVFYLTFIPQHFFFSFVHTLESIGASTFYLFFSFLIPVYYSFNKAVLNPLFLKRIAFLERINTQIFIKHTGIHFYIFLILVIFSFNLFYFKSFLLILLFLFMLFSTLFLYEKYKEKQIINFIYKYIYVLFYLYYIALFTVFLMGGRHFDVVEAFLLIFLFHILLKKHSNKEFNKQITFTRILLIGSPNMYILIYILLIFMIKYITYSLVNYPAYIFQKFFIENTVLFVLPILIIKAERILELVWIKKEKMFYLLTFLIFILLGFLIWKNVFYLILHEEKTAPLINRLYMGSYSFMYYLFKFLYPFDLSAMHPYPEGLYGTLPFIYKLMFYISLFFVLAVSIILYFIRKEKELLKQIVFGLLFFLINIFFVLHLVPIWGKVIVADRYTYLAYFGLFFSVVSIGTYYFKRIKNSFFRNILVIGFILYLTLLGFSTYTRNEVWKNDDTFWSDVIKKMPENHYAYFSKALFFFNKGDMNNALNFYTRAINMHKDDAEYYSNRGAVYIRLKEYEKATEDLNRAIMLNNEDALAYNNRGNAHFELFRFEEAENDFKKALSLNQNLLSAQNNLEKATKAVNFYKDAKLGVVFEDNERSLFFNEIGLKRAWKNDFAMAREDFSYSLMYNNKNINALINRGISYASEKKFSEALLDLKSAVKISPDNGNIYLNMGNMKHEINDKSACKDWEKAFKLGIEEGGKMFDKFCK